MPGNRSERRTGKQSLVLGSAAAFEAPLAGAGAELRSSRPEPRGARRVPSPTIRTGNNEKYATAVGTRRAREGAVNEGLPCWTAGPGSQDPALPPSGQIHGASGQPQHRPAAAAALLLWARRAEGRALSPWQEGRHVKILPEPSLQLSR